ncbi:hypothetical protein [Streptomyces sp. Ag109_G2-15]|uniref:hypothetical protein n=1 Tax=Streptomyces sp. Ag109_G2-15 TaxID=1938850 RepID=UPI00211C2BA4|nr:hypothetical protein [Streptomyces sp. Ag109_G2-15]
MADTGCESDRHRELLWDVGHEIPTTLLPSLLTATLGAIEGVSDALAGAVRFGGGVLTGVPARRRKVAVGDYAANAVLGAATAGATAAQLFTRETGAVFTQRMFALFTQETPGLSFRAWAGGPLRA